MLARILSAAVVLPFVLLAISAGGWWFTGLVWLACVICLAEFMAMALPNDRPMQVALTALGSALVPCAALGYLTSSAGLGVVAVGLIGVLLLFLFRPGDIATVASRMGLAVAGLAWIGALMATVLGLRLLPGGVGWIALACILAWGSDTGGYFVGRFFGRHRLYEKVSPKKTWEGAVGGALTATALAFVSRSLLGAPDVETGELLLLAPLGAAVGQAGDLVESLLKRSVGVKDSGKIMPGHGGLFDRVDALLFVAPVLFAYATGFRALIPDWM